MNNSLRLSLSSNSTNSSFLSLRLDFNAFFLNSSGSSVATDPAGNVYVTGTTRFNGLPVKNAFQPTYGGGFTDVFVAKFNSSGSLVFCTYFGGSLGDESQAIAVDQSGNSYITGRTISIDFPTKNAFHKINYGNQEPDAFVAKFNTNGGLVFSTYLGGSSNDGGNDIVVDSQGNCFIVVPTLSSDFLLKNTFQTTFSYGHYDIFVAKFSSNGSLLYSTFFGGNSDDFGYSIAVDKSDNILN